MVKRSPSKVRKWGSQRNPRNRLRLGDSVSRVTSAHACTRSSACVYDVGILFSRMHHYHRIHTKGSALVQRSFCTSHPLPRRSLSYSPSSEFAVSRVGVIVLRCIYRGSFADSDDGAPGHGFGRKRYYFSQFAKQMLPIVKPPALSTFRRSRVYFAPVLRETVVLHRDILSLFFQQNEFFFARVLRAIVKSSCSLTGANTRDARIARERCA